MKSKYLQYSAWFIALISILGSLYFSEIMHLPPCILCWYQRIFMYPEAIILAVGLIVKDFKRIPYYILPLSSMGAIIAVYHNLLYYNILPESAAPCSLGVSCTVKLIEWYGFITIPLLSLAAFSAITILMIISLKAKETND